MDALYIVITDGNRTVGIEQDVEMPHKMDDSLALLLCRYDFSRWIPGTICVNGANIPDATAYQTLPQIQRSTLTMTDKPYTNRMRVTVKTLKDDPSKLTWKQLHKLKEKAKTVSKAAV